MQGNVEQPRDAYRWWVLVTVVFGAFAGLLDSTIVNTALPRIQHDFDANLHLASYVVTGYVLAAGVIVAGAGFLANRFGMKRVYLISLALFTVCSALCGIAPNIGLLIAARVLQGAGGAALVPISSAILFSVFSYEERGKANGLFGIPLLAAPTLGPTLGGYLTQYVDWRWIFFVNLPVGLAGIAMGMHVLRETPIREKVRFDVPGFLLAASGLGLLLYGISNLAYDGWADISTVSGPILVSLLVLAGFMVTAWSGRAPLLNLRLYQRRNYLPAAVLALVGPITIFGRGFVLPQYLQGLRGQTPFDAGLLLLWQGIGAVLGSLATGQCYNRLGPKSLIILGLIGVVLTSGLIALLTNGNVNLTVLAPLLLISGFALTLMLQSVNTLALDGIHGAELPDATTLNVVTRNIMVSLCVAALTNFLQSRVTTHLQELAHGTGSRFVQVGVGGFVAAQAPPAVRAALALAYHDTFVLLAIAVLPALLIVWLVRQPSRRLRTAGTPPSIVADHHEVPGGEADLEEDRRVCPQPRRF